MALLPSIGSAIKKGLEAAYKASKGKSSSGLSGGSSGSKEISSTPTITGPRNIATRDYFEAKDMKCNGNDKTGNICAIDPRTGHSASITKGFYDTIGGTSYIFPDMTERVEKTIGSGRYKLPGWSGSSYKHF